MMTWTFIKARPAPFRHRSSVKIAVEGDRDFSPEKKESYPSYPVKYIQEARPPPQIRPTSVKISEGRISNRTESR